VRQRHVSRTEREHHPQRGNRRVDRVTAFHADQRGDAAALEGPLDVVRRQREHKGVGIAVDHPMDDIDLLQRRRDSLLALIGGGYVDRPELAADATRVQPGDVRHDRGLVRAQIEHVQIACGTFHAQRPGLCRSANSASARTTSSRRSIPHTHRTAG
jgi:hypothetical protein